MSTTYTNLLAVHLWREWRTHRRTLIALALILPVLITAIVLITGDLTGAMSPRYSQVAAWAPLVCSLTVLISIGCDLFASERRRGIDVTLARIPGALSCAYLARLLFFYLTVLGALIFGDLIAGLLCWTKPALFETLSVSWLAVGIPLLVGSSWLFACSTWVWSSALSAPVTLLFLALVTLPITLDFSFGTAPAAHNPYPTLLVVLPFLGAPLVGWFSFVYGRRAGRTPTRAVRAGVTLGIVLFVPSWAWAGARNMTAPAPQPVVANAILGEGGQHLFLNLGNGPEPTAYSSAILDLDSGELAPVGIAWRSWWQSPRGASLRTVSAGIGVPLTELIDDMDFSSLRRSAGPHAWPGLLADAIAKSRGPGVKSLYDGSTGEILRTSKTQRLADFWHSFPLPEFNWKNTRVRAAGSGFVLNPRSASAGGPRHWDPLTKTSVNLSAYGETLGPVSRHDVLITPLGWVIKTNSGPCQLYDPVTQEFKALPAVPRDAQLRASLDDGSTIFIAKDHPCRFDLATNELTRIDVTFDSDVPMNWYGAFVWTIDRPALSASRATVVECLAHVSGDRTHMGRRQGFALFDPRNNSLRVLSLSSPGPQHGRPNVLAHGDGFTFVTKTGRQILRVDWGTGDITMVYELGSFQL